MSLRTVFASALNTRVVFASSARGFHASPVAAKTATEKVKEVAEKVCVLSDLYPTKGI